jgi:hypothetical protein
MHLECLHIDQLSKMVWSAVIRNQMVTHVETGLAMNFFDDRLNSYFPEQHATRFSKFGPYIF